MRPPCPECEDLGIITTVVKLQSDCIRIVPVRKFLKGGQWHQHDSTTEYVDTYECSGGHVFQIQTTGKPCWCGWLPLQAQRKRDVESLAEDGVCIAYNPDECVKERLL